MGLLFAGILVIGIPAKRFRSNVALGAILCILTFGGLACGGGSGGNGGGNGCGAGQGCGAGTPKGSYPVTVTAMTADQAISHSVTFTLVVN